nr:MAG: hypothetical protein [Picornavirales sp.]
MNSSTNATTTAANQVSSTTTSAHVSTPASLLINNDSTSTLVDSAVSEAVTVDPSFSKITYDTLGISPMDSDSVIFRRSLLTTVNWEPSYTRGTVLQVSNCPRDILSSASFVGMSALSIHHYLSAEALEFTIQAPASPFCAGALQLVWLPSSYGSTNFAGKGPLTANTQTLANYDNMIDTNSIILNIGDGNTATLTVPLTNCLSNLITYFAPKTQLDYDNVVPNDSFYNFWGNLLLVVFNPLLGNNEDHSFLTCRIYARLVNPKLSMLVSPHTVVLQGAALATLATTAATAGATALAEKGAEAVVHKVGKKCTYYSEVGEDPLAMNLALSNDHRSILSLGYDVKDFSDSHVDKLASGPETDVRAICALRSRVNTHASWTSTQTAGHIIGTYKLAPNMGTYTQLVNGTTIVHQSNLAGVSSQYSYWRGSITVTIEIIGNAYSRGTLLLCYSPPTTSPPGTVESAISNPHAVINIAEVRRVTFRVPYHATTPWLATSRIKSDGSFDHPESHLGNFRLMVMNPIITNDASKILELPINVYVHSDDMDFRLPDPNRFLSCSTWFKVDTPPSALEDLPPLARTYLQSDIPGVNAFGSTADPAPTSLMPTSHTDLNQLLTRRTALFTGEVASAYSKITVPIPCAGLRGGLTVPSGYAYFAPPTFYNAFSGAFAWQSGSQVISIIFGNNASENVNLIAQIIYTGDLDWPDTTPELKIESITDAQFLEVADEDASIICNNSLNSRREFGIPWYNTKQMLPAPVHCREEATRPITRPAYVPSAILELYIHAPFSGENLKFSMSTAVGPNFTFSQFCGMPNMVLYLPIYEPPAFATSLNELPRTIANRAIVKSVNVTRRTPKHVRFADEFSYSSSSETETEAGYACKFCPTMPKDFVSYMHHLKTSHWRLLKETYRCPYCSRPVDPMDPESHSSDCHIFSPQTCQVCHHTSTNGERTLNHLRNNHSRLDFYIGYRLITGGFAIDSPISPVFQHKPVRVNTTGLELQMDSFSSLAAGATALAGIGLAATVNRAIPAATDSLTETLESLKKSSDSATKTSDNINNFFANPALTQTADRLPETLTGLNSILGMLPDTLSSVTTTSDKLGSLTDSLNGLTPDLTSISNSIADLNENLRWFLGRDEKPFKHPKLNSINEKTIAVNVSRAAATGTLEPILSDILVHLIEAYSPINPTIMTLGLKALQSIFAPTSSVAITINGLLLHSAVKNAHRFIPDSFREFFSYDTEMQAGETSELFDFARAIIVVAGFGVTASFGFCSVSEFFRDFSKNFSFINLARASSSILVLLESISKIWKWAQEKYFGKDRWEGYDWLVKNRTMISDFQDAYIDHQKYTHNQILNSGIRRSIAIKHAEQAKLIAAVIMKIKTGNNEIANLQRQCDFFIQLEKQVRVVPPGKIRVRPTVLTLQGSSQCGKTFLSSTVIPHYVQELMNWPKEPVFLVSSATDDFMSGYSQQPIAVIDDFLQMREGKDLTGFVNMIGNAPYRVNMADLSEKGTQFLSELVIVSMNSAHPKIDKFVTEPNAVYNRLYDHYYHVVPKPAFLKNGRLDIDKVRSTGNSYKPDNYLNFHKITFINGRRNVAPDNENNAPLVSFYEIVAEIVTAINDEEEAVENFQEAEVAQDDLPEFPRNFLPDGWFGPDGPQPEFQARFDQNQTRALRILKFTRNLTQVLNSTSPSMDLLNSVISDLKWISSQGIDSSDFKRLVPDPNSSAQVPLLSSRTLAYLANLSRTKLLLKFPSDLKSDYDRAQASLNAGTTRPADHKWWESIEENNTHFSLLFTDPWYSRLWKHVYGAYQAYEQWRMSMCVSYPFTYAFFSSYIITILLSIAINGTVWLGTKLGLIGGGSAPTYVKCDICGSPFANADGVALHKKYFHPPPPEKDDEAPLKAAEHFHKTQAEASWYSSGSPTTGAKAKVKVMRPQAATPNKKEERTETQSDVPELFPLLKKNIVRLSSSNAFSIRGLGWKDDLIITNRHFINALSEGEVIMMTRWLPNSDQTEEVPLIFKSQDCVLLQWSDTEPIDLAIWRTGWRASAFRDISRHFLKESDIDRVSGQRGYRAGAVVTTLSTLTYTTNEMPYDHSTMSSVVFPLAIVSEGTANRGVCGSPWVVENTALFGAGKICGIHAFGGTSYIGAVPVNIEMLEEAVQAFPTLTPAISRVTMPTTPANDIELQFHVHHGKTLPTDAFRQPAKTDIFPSPIHGEVLPVTHEPAVLSPNDKRLREPKTFRTNLLRKTDFRPTWYKNEMEAMNAALQVSEDINALPTKITPRLLTLDEAINGVDGPAFMQDSGLQMNKSPGYPWNKRFPGISGKYPFFQDAECPHRQKWHIKDPELYQRVTERLELAFKGKTPDNSIWLDVMKDELRPKEKCANGGTRIINAPPLDLMIVMNILFGAFRINWMDPDHVGEPLESALGLDPKDWFPRRALTLRQALILFGIDFTKFDSTQPLQMYELVALIINLWYDQNPDNLPEHNLARETILMEIGQTLHLFLDELYTDDHGLPSGVPGGFTTIINILVNRLLAMITFGRTGLALPLYKKTTRNLFMGDDGEHVVLPTGNEEIDERLKKYNRVTLAAVANEIGMKATMPDKISALTPSDTFEQMTFLKSAYVDAVIPGYYLPGMSKETIGNLINWYRPRKNPQQFETNLSEALKFAAVHGKEYYETLRAALLANPKIQTLYSGRLLQVLPTFNQTFYSTYLPTGLEETTDPLFV